MPTRRALKDQRRKGSVVERVRRVCTVDGQVWVTGEERWDALSIRSALGKGQELKIHVDYAGDTEGVSKRDSSEG